MPVSMYCTSVLFYVRANHTLVERKIPGNERVMNSMNPSYSIPSCASMMDACMWYE